MTRGKPREDAELGSDSFLDIVANMVGILILLVMVAGLRAQRFSAVQSDENTQVVSQLANLASQGRSLEHEALELEAQKADLARTTAARRMERDMLEQLRAERAQQLAEARRSLDDRTRAELDLKQSLTQAEQRLREFEVHIARAKEDSAQESVEIENFPTPISHVVHGDEMHFQLRNGRIQFIPMDEMVEQLKMDIRRSALRLRDQSQVSEMLGPLGGFRVRYTIARVDVPVSIDTARGGLASSNGGGGSYARVFEFSLLPESELLGETLEEAMQPGSEFRHIVATMNPKSTSVTLWTYPESFAEYRALKRELYKAGLAVAGRPMPDGQLIGGSPHGSKSVAQ